jgi:hypothetical protein
MQPVHADNERRADHADRLPRRIVGLYLRRYAVFID